MSGRGSAYLTHYHEGKALTRGQSILAKCAECMGDYFDGRMDCAVEGCPLYPWSAYGRFSGKSDPDLYNHTRKQVTPPKNAPTAHAPRERGIQTPGQGGLFNEAG